MAKTTHIYIKVETHEGLKALAKAEGRTISGMLDILVKERVKKS